MIVHFPIALWPAHAVLRGFAGRLPPDAAATVGFWVLALGTALGWLAAVAGMADLAAWPGSVPPRRWRTAAWHAAVNGSVLVGYTAVAAIEAARYPAIVCSPRQLGFELLLLAALGAGNFLGGEMVWGSARSERDAPSR